MHASERCQVLRLFMPSSAGQQFLHFDYHSPRNCEQERRGGREDRRHSARLGSDAVHATWAGRARVAGGRGVGR
eukprot:2269587-Pyramimonas_sp.AAC.1